MCNLLSIKRCGYHAWLKKQPGKGSCFIYIRDELVRRELRKSCKKVVKYAAKIGMRHLNLQAKAKKKFKVTTDSKHNLPVAPNLLNCDFTATAPNQKWCGDISSVWTEEGWLYLAAVIDLYPCTVISWSI